MATACAYRTARIVAETSAILGYASETEEFTQLAARIKTAFNTVYVDGGRIVSDCPTVYSLALVFGLLDEEQIDWAGRRLSELVVASGHHISTGFAGTPFIMDALSSTGHVETAYRLLLQKECPSWLQRALYDAMCDSLAAVGTWASGHIRMREPRSVHPLRNVPSAEVALRAASSSSASMEEPSSSPGLSTR
ncbi:hypothetical protein [Microbacterium sp. W4I20]|uniref:alpha-L-rhamnosidase-related protein n=1 Tax=Microbacterium sp. W4I20 TaxID=3042262 RepID=UPI00277FD6D4|nr:hypothetical protein [Microbacterium sp. W4I20]